LWRLIFGNVPPRLQQEGESAQRKFIMKNRKILFEAAAIVMVAMVMAAGFTSCNKANAQTGDGSAVSSGKASSKSVPKIEYAPASDFAYDLNKEGDGIIVKRYSGTNSTLAIPAEIEGYPVTEIAKDAFQWGTYNSTKVPLVSVIIPETVKTIGEAAFLRQSLSSISFPASLRVIGYMAFYETALQHVDLSHTGITFVAKNAFSGCHSLQTVKLPDTVETIEDSAFSLCSKLTSANIPASIKEIGNKAFMYCELTSLSIPDTITSVKIASNSFEGCDKPPIATRKRLQDLGYKGEF
jgi:hypothetical protein